MGETRRRGLADRVRMCRPPLREHKILIVVSLLASFFRTLVNVVKLIAAECKRILYAELNIE